MLDAGYWMLDLDAGYWILDAGLLDTEILDAGNKWKFMSYRKLQIWMLAREVVIEVHEMTLKLPKFELYEEGVTNQKIK